MPRKTIEKALPKRRNERIKADIVPSTNLLKYKKLEDVLTHISKLKTLTEWVVETSINYVILKKNKVPWTIPEIKIVVNDGLGYTVSVFDWLIPEDHPIYKSNRRSLRYNSILCLVTEIEKLMICNGVNITQDAAIIHHVVPMLIEENKEEEEELALTPFRSATYYRVKNCFTLIGKETSILKVLNRMYAFAVKVTINCRNIKKTKRNKTW